MIFYKKKCPRTLPEAFQASNKGCTIETCTSVKRLNHTKRWRKIHFFFILNIILSNYLKNGNLVSGHASLNSQIGQSLLKLGIPICLCINTVQVLLEHQKS